MMILHMLKNKNVSRQRNKRNFQVNQFQIQKKQATSLSTLRTRKQYKNQDNSFLIVLKKWWKIKKGKKKNFKEF
uniref:Uncharacterized protein n=1 Tax=Solanum tuberosum TaxID=4113 RepID=M1A1G8_SOLTU